jgi:hemimethylated DNA binding protein
LVHATESATYAAQDNLLADAEGLPISHPLLEVYFDAWENGHYMRNATAWQTWE